MNIYDDSESISDYMATTGGIHMYPPFPDTAVSNATVYSWDHRFSKAGLSEKLQSKRPWMLGSSGRFFFFFRSFSCHCLVAQAFFEHSVMVKEYTGHRRARDLFQRTTQSCEFRDLHIRSGFAVGNAVRLKPPELARKTMLSFSKPEPSLQEMASGYWTQCISLKWCTVWGILMHQLLRWVRFAWRGVKVLSWHGSKLHSRVWSTVQLLMFYCFSVVSCRFHHLSTEDQNVVFSWQLGLQGRFSKLDTVGRSREFWHKASDSSVVVKFGQSLATGQWKH